MGARLGANIENKNVAVFSFPYIRMLQPISLKLSYLGHNCKKITITSHFCDRHFWSQDIKILCFCLSIIFSKSIKDRTFNFSMKDGKESSTAVILTY